MGQRGPGKTGRMSDEELAALSREQKIEQELRAQEWESRRPAREAAIKAEMAPPGSLGLCPLLEKKRLEYLIPDGAFKCHSSFERVSIYQLEVTSGDTKFIKGGMIHMPDTVQGRKHMEEPIGVLVSAGLKALDTLRSNGIDIGHNVKFIRSAPYRTICDIIGSIECYLIEVNAGDICGSYDLQEAINTGECQVRVVESEVDGQISRTHVFVDKDGKTWDPVVPWGSDF